LISTIVPNYILCCEQLIYVAILLSQLCESLASEMQNIQDKSINTYTYIRT